MRRGGDAAGLQGHQGLNFGAKLLLNLLRGKRLCHYLFLPFFEISIEADESHDVRKVSAVSNRPIPSLKKRTAPSACSAALEAVWPKCEENIAVHRTDGTGCGKTIGSSKITRSAIAGGADASIVAIPPAPAGPSVRNTAPSPSGNS